MGMVIYFQFLKFMATMYCIMTVISIPSMVFYFSGNPTDRLSMSDLIPALSLGNIGQSETACASGIYEPSTSLVEITINCPFGKLDEVTSFGQVSFGQFIQCALAKEAAKEEGIPLSEYDFGFYPERCSYREFQPEVQRKLNAAFEE